MNKNKQHTDSQKIYDALLKDMEDLSLPDSLKPESIEASLQDIKPTEKKPTPYRFLYAAAAIVLVVLVGTIGIHFGIGEKSKSALEAVPESTTNSQGENLDTAQLKTADSYDSIISFFLERQKSFLEASDSSLKPSETADRAPAGSSPILMNAAGDAHSETNLQVEGVSEDDMLMTDGRYLYSLYPAGQFAAQEIRIVDAENPQKLRLAAKIRAKDCGFDVPAKSLEPRSFFLSDGYLVTLWRSGITVPSSSPNRCGSCLEFTTHVAVFDIKNSQKPQKVQSFSINGDTFSARMVGKDLLLVTRYDVLLDVSDETLKDICIPTYTLNGVTKKFPASTIQCVKDSKKAGYILVARLHIETPDAVPEVLAVLGSGESLFCSKDSLLIADPFWHDERSDEATYIISKEQTRFLAFSLKDQIHFEGEAILPGTILNQFSMDEYNGYYRIALNDRREGTSVTILNRDLTVRGSVFGIAKGETIKSARFLGDTAYLVTFRDIDPLFVLDLKDPEKPQILGKLKVPGFSNYLHPLEGGYLLGIGQDGKEVSHLKISLFDVREPNAPKEVDTYVFQSPIYVRSALERTHKALLQFQEPQSFAIPVEEYSGIPSEAKNYLQAFKIKDGKIEIGTRYSPTCPKEAEELTYADNSRAVIQRGAYIGNTVFTASANGLVSYSMETGDVLDILY